MNPAGDNFDGSGGAVGGLYWSKLGEEKFMDVTVGCYRQSDNFTAC